MSFIYHLLPKPMLGDTLYPLNELKSVYPEEYYRNVKKYDGRKDLMMQKVPKLDCLWNDVLFFSSINPKIVLEKLSTINTKLELKRTQYIKIPLKNILPYPSVIFTRRKDAPDNDFSFSEDESRPLTSDSYKELQVIPRETIQYWEEAKENGRPMLWFYHIPHILVKGHLKIDSFKIEELI